MPAAVNLQANLSVNTSSLNASSRQIQQALGRITGQASEFQKSLDASTARVFAFGATTTVLQAVNQSFKALVSTTIEVEKRLIEINSIFQASEAQFNKFRNSIFEVAKNTGQAFNTVAEGAAELARQGLSAEETAKRLNAALVLSRISGMDAEKSVKSLTAAINGFTSAGLNAEQIVNKIVAVDTAFAVSAQDLADGFSRAGSTAEDAGVSFDELLGLITAVEQRTARGGAVIGNAFKSIFTRLSRGDTIEQLKGLGVEIDAAQNGVQKLDALSKALENVSDPTVASKIKELAGGVFQINVVSAALKDLSSETSIFAGAAETAAKATNEAFTKNELLNTSLAAQINSLVASLTSLAEKIGGVTIAPLLGNLVTLAEKVSGAFDKALDPEKGNAFIQGLLKAIGGFISGPGLVLITTAFLKITVLIAKFAKEGFQAILQIGSAQEKNKQIQGGIVGLLQRDVQLRKDLANQTLSQAQKEQAVLDAIKRENQLLLQQKQLVQSIVTLAGQKGLTGYNPTTGFTGKNKASGFVPNFSASPMDEMMEKASAKAHGYKAGKVFNTKLHDGRGGSEMATVNSAEQIETVRGPNGKLGTYVIPPNGFAANGFIPNFATATRAELRDAISNKTLQHTGGKGFKTASGNTASTAQVREANKKLKNDSNNITDISKITGSTLPAVIATQGSREGDINFTSEGYKFKWPVVSTSDGEMAAVVKQFERDYNYNKFESLAKNEALRQAQKYSSALGGSPLQPEKASDIKDPRGFKGAINAAMGSVFDSAMSAIVGSEQARQEDGDFDVRGGDRRRLQKLFGQKVNTPSGIFKNLGDYKFDAYGSSVKKSMRDKTLKEAKSKGALGDQVQKRRVRSRRSRASGFIPNFAAGNFVFDADKMDRKMSNSILKTILASKKKKDLLMAPAGAGKSTAAAKLGRFIKSPSDVSRAGSFTILSGAARAKKGLMSAGLQNIIQSVNNSGGRVSYLHVPNSEIQRRRYARLGMGSDDIRTPKQLKGTLRAPKNQYDFLSGVKRMSRRFSLLKGRAGGFVPNFANSLMGAIEREKAAGYSGSEVRVGQSEKLKNAANPLGYGVFNKDQGNLSKAFTDHRGEDLQKSGKAGGFVPSFAAQGVNQALFDKFDKAVAKNAKSLDKASESADKASDGFGKIFAIQALVAGLQTVTSGLTAAKTREFQAVEESVQEKKNEIENIRAKTEADIANVQSSNKTKEAKEKEIEAISKASDAEIKKKEALIQGQQAELSSTRSVKTFTEEIASGTNTIGSTISSIIALDFAIGGKLLKAVGGSITKLGAWGIVLGASIVTIKEFAAAIKSAKNKQTSVKEGISLSKKQEAEERLFRRAGGGGKGEVVSRREFKIPEQKGLQGLIQKALGGTPKTTFVEKRSGGGSEITRNVLSMIDEGQSSQIKGLAKALEDARNKAVQDSQGGDPRKAEESAKAFIKLTESVLKNKETLIQLEIQSQKAAVNLGKISAERSKSVGVAEGAFDNLSLMNSMPTKSDTPAFIGRAVSGQLAMADAQLSKVNTEELVSKRDEAKQAGNADLVASLTEEINKSSSEFNDKVQKAGLSLIENAMRAGEELKEAGKLLKQQQSQVFNDRLDLAGSLKGKTIDTQKVDSIIGNFANAKTDEEQIAAVEKLSELKDELAQFGPEFLKGLMAARGLDEAKQVELTKGVEVASLMKTNLSREDAESIVAQRKESGPDLDETNKKISGLTQALDSANKEVDKFKEAFKNGKGIVAATEKFQSSLEDMANGTIQASEMLGKISNVNTRAAEAISQQDDKIKTMMETNKIIQKMVEQHGQKMEEWYKRFSAE